MKIIQLIIYMIIIKIIYFTTNKTKIIMEDYLNQVRKRKKKLKFEIFMIFLNSNFDKINRLFIIYYIKINIFYIFYEIY